MSESLGVRPGHQYLKISKGRHVNGRLVGDGTYSEEKTGSQERESWEGWSARPVLADHAQGEASLAKSYIWIRGRGVAREQG